MQKMLCVVTMLAAFVSVATGQRPRRAKAVPVPTVMLRGTVVRDDGATPIPFSTIDLRDTKVRRFGNEEGEFSFKLTPGSYRIRVRQIGFIPRDTVINIRADVPPSPLVMRLKAFAITLTPMTVKAMLHCTRAGVDSVDDPNLGTLMAALRENANREIVLRQDYPFEYTVEDVQTVTPDSSYNIPQDQKPTVYDTLRYRSDVMMSYQRGTTVFTDRTDMRGAWERMRLPSMVDFGNAAFMGTHCFTYDLTETDDYIIHFLPLDTISVPDVAGTITLDTATLVVRTITARLTQPKNVAPGFEHLEIRTTYREFLPRIAIPVDVSSMQRFRTWDNMLVTARERQSIQRLRFLQRVPDGVAREHAFATTTQLLRAERLSPE